MACIVVGDLPPVAPGVEVSVIAGDLIAILVGHGGVLRLVGVAT